MPELKRAADPSLGKKVFAENCALCHGDDGLGKRKGVIGDAKGYQFPPLWGPDSFNDGAGMIGSSARPTSFIPTCPTASITRILILSVEKFWDVAAFVQSQPRPHKADLDKDFPVRTEKPVDTGYGPYVDG